MMQAFKADRFIGKRIRVDDTMEDVVQFDNMSNRPIKGTTNWNRYSIVLDCIMKKDRRIIKS